MMLHRLFRFVSITVLTACASAQVSTPIITADPMEISARQVYGESAHGTEIRLEGLAPAEVSPTGVAGALANFSVGESGGRSFTDTFALRGLANTPLFGDPAVTVYLDDLPLGSGFTFPTELVGFDRAELSRGPGQNTRFGRAGTAGVLRFSTADRLPADTAVTEISYGNYGTRTAQARGLGKEEDRTILVAAGYSARDGYITNTRLGQRIDGRESTSGLVRVRSGTKTTGEWSLLVLGQRARDGVQPLVPLSGPKFQVNRSAEGVTHLDSWAGALSGLFATESGDWKTTTSYSDWKLGPATNVLSFGFAELQNASELRQRQWSEELSWNAQVNPYLHATAGLFASDAKTEGAFTRAFSGFVFERSTYRTTHRSLAGFAEISFKVSTSLTVTPGVRLETNEKKIDRREIVPAPNPFSRSHSSSAVLPKVDLRYDLDASTAFSGSLDTSYKPGGFSAFTGNRALAAFAAERLVGVDAAITRHDRGDRWSVALRGFAYSVRGYQIERSFQTGAQADDYLVVNAGRARSVGGEAEVAWKITKGLTAEASLGLTDVTLRDFHDPYTGVNYSGKRAPYAPTYDAHVALTYRHLSGWFAGAAVTAVGRTYYTESETPMFSQGAYMLIGGRVGYQKDRYKLALYGENLGNREYFSSITPGTNHGTPGAPRTYGVEAGLRF